ncbi:MULTISPECIES: phosphotransferase enzyme family protein [Paenibacillus]|uniref:phosphotransferase enzyme family protein n=1 Tax=Paenibacillus TaxID=44249 RepID=UPI0022B86CBA|nr:phosphotransferase [Paenibacillus caseinilyticus]MCZ8522443.1 phosphotransferase [Paenibacillus caseinilyticus]
MGRWQDRITERWVDQIAAEHLGVGSGTLREVGGFENKIYGFSRDSREYILRVSHSSHRSREQIVSELDWVCYLADHGVNVSRPVPLRSGAFCESVEAEDEGCCVLTLMTRAPGAHAGAGSAAWGTGLFESWGAITGQMHALAPGYQVPEGIEPRPSEDSLDVGDPEGMPPAQADVWGRYLQLQQEIDGLKREPDGFGLCHRDLHQGNFYVDNAGKITAFDFDDCGYEHYLHDIAMAVYYSSVFPDWRRPVTDPEVLASSSEVFLDAFMKGYGREHTLSPRHWAKLSLFLERRRCDLCLLLFEEWGRPDSIPEQRAWLESNIEGIRSGTPAIPVSW